MGPDLLQQQAPALFWAQPAATGLAAGLTDQTFEVPLQLGPVLLQESPFDDLPSNQRLAGLPIRQPDQAGDDDRISAAEGRQRQQAGALIAGALMGHHRGGAAEVNGKGAGHWPKLKGNCRLRG